MIRPVTIICGVLAFTSGVYLYHAKHDVELMDLRIVDLGKQTEVLRADSRRRLDDWIRLGEPEQLHKYSDEYLGLKTIQPTQFVRLTELQARLPEARLIVPEEQMDAPSQPRTDRADTLPPAPSRPAGGYTATIAGATGTGAASSAAASSGTIQGASKIVRRTDETRSAEPKPAVARPAVTAAAPAKPAVLVSPPQALASRAHLPNDGAPAASGTPAFAGMSQGLPPLQAQGPGQVGMMAHGPASLGPASPGLASPGPAFPGPASPGPASPGGASARSAEGHNNAAVPVIPPAQMARVSAPRSPPLQAQLADAQPSRPSRLHPPESQGQGPQPQGVQVPGAQVPGAQVPGARVQAPRPQAGSLLGMAHGSVPLPAPTPVSATWSGR